MRYCPNPACPFAVKFHRPADYRAGTPVCSDCGAALVDAPPAAAAAVGPREPRPPSDALQRLAISVAAMVATLLTARAPLFGLPESVAGPASVGVGHELFAFGLTPFVLGFLFVELVAAAVPPLRPLRIGSARQRRALVVAALGVGTLFVLVQTWNLEHFLASGLAAAAAPPARPLQLVLAHLGLAGLALAVSRWGLGNGFLVLGLASVVSEVLSLGQRLWQEVKLETVAPGTAFLPVALTAAVAGLVISASLRSRRRAGATAFPATAPFPIAPAISFQVATMMLLAPATLGLFEVQRVLQSSAWLYNGVAAFIAFDVTVVLGFLFFRPAAVGGLWRRWHPDIDVTGVVAQARSLLPVAMILAVAGLVVLPWLSGQAAASGLTLPRTVLLVTAPLMVLALVEEYQARRRLGKLVPIRPLHRMAEVEPVLKKLSDAGIEAHAQSAAWRATAQFFGPETPVWILVPEAKAGDARALIDVE